MTNEINSFLQDYSIAEINNNTVHEIGIEYDPVSFRFTRVCNSISQIPEKELPKEFCVFIKAQEGRITFLWKIGMQVNRDGYIKMNEACVQDIMEKIYALKYYEDEEI